MTSSNTFAAFFCGGGFMCALQGEEATKDRDLPSVLLFRPGGGRGGVDISHFQRPLSKAPPTMSARHIFLPAAPAHCTNAKKMLSQKGYFLLQKMLNGVLPKTILFTLTIAYHHETLAKNQKNFDGLSAVLLVARSLVS